MSHLKIYQTYLWWYMETYCQEVPMTWTDRVLKLATGLVYSGNETTFYPETIYSHFWNRNIHQFRRNVVPPWRARQAHSGSNSPMTSQNVNAKQSRKVTSSVRFRHICTFLDKIEKNNQSPNWGRDSGIPSSCPRFATSMTQQALSWIANLGHSDGIPSSLCNVVIDSINLGCAVIFKPMTLGESRAQATPITTATQTCSRT